MSKPIKGRYRRTRNKTVFPMGLWRTRDLAPRPMAFPRAWGVATIERVRRIDRGAAA
jgi:hypothetical protein